MISKYSTIITNNEAGNYTIILNRPDKRNSLNEIMINELLDAFKKAGDDNSIKVITLSGAGKVFCSGADLAYLKDLSSKVYKDNLMDSLRLSELLLEIYSSPKPVIAIVKGAALAGGCGIATVCDFIIADSKAVFGYPEVKIGFVAALVSTFLVRQIGERKARNLLLSGRLISAQEAKDIDLITYFAEEKDLEKLHCNLIETLMENSPLAMSETKKILSTIVYKDIKNELKSLAEINANFRKTDEFIEGISSFLEKRTPSWRRS